MSKCCKDDVKSEMDLEPFQGNKHWLEIGQTSNATTNYSLVFDNQQKCVLVINRSTENVTSTFTMKHLFMQAVMNEISANTMQDLCCLMYQEATNQMAEDLWHSLYSAMHLGVIKEVDWKTE